MCRLDCKWRLLNIGTNRFTLTSNGVATISYFLMSSYLPLSTVSHRIQAISNQFGLFTIWQYACSDKQWSVALETGSHVWPIRSIRMGRSAHTDLINLDCAVMAPSTDCHFAIVTRPTRTYSVISFGTVHELLATVITIVVPKHFILVTPKIFYASVNRKCL